MLWRAATHDLSRTTGAWCGQGFVCVLGAGPTQESKEKVRWFHEPVGQTIKVKFPFLKDAGKEKTMKGPQVGEGSGQWERKLVDIDSQIICRRRRKEMAGGHRNWLLPLECLHVTVFMTAVALLAILDRN